MKKTKIQWKYFIVLLAVPLLVGGLAAFLTRGQMEEFQMMNQPKLSPPSWLFGVVWTILYVLMGISSYRVFVSKSNYKSIALALYLGSLAFNFVWPIVFFNFQSFLVAFFVIVIMIVLVGLTIVFYLKCDKIAARLQIPYFLWLFFAGYLNLAVYILNR